MLTEWVLVIWFGTTYPLTDKESFSNLTVLHRFSNQEDCVNAGAEWANKKNKYFQCIKIMDSITRGVFEHIPSEDLDFNVPGVYLRSYNETGVIENQ